MKVKCTVDTLVDDLDLFVVEDEEGYHYALLHPFYTNLTSPDADEIVTGDEIEVDHWNLMPVPEEHDESLDRYLAPYKAIAAYRARLLG